MYICCVLTLTPTTHGLTFTVTHGRLQAVAGTSEDTRRKMLLEWSKAPQARAAHPREEHLMPLMVVSGAAGSQPGRNIFNAPILKCICSDFRFG